MCVDVLPAVCGKSPHLDPSSGRTCRSSPVSLWGHRGEFELIRQLPGRQPASQPYKSSPASPLSSIRTHTPKQGGEEVYSALLSPDARTKVLCALGFFQIQQTMSWTVTLAVVFLACRLSVGQCEYSSPDFWWLILMWFCHIICLYRVTNDLQQSGKRSFSYRDFQKSRSDPAVIFKPILTQPGSSFWNLLSSSASCRGRCGTEYYRGHLCQCDYTCLSYEECCEDYESQCTTSKTTLSSSRHWQTGAAERPTQPPKSLSPASWLVFVCNSQLVQRSLRGGLQERPEVQLRPQLPEIQPVLLRLPDLLWRSRWAEVVLPWA